MTTVSRKPERLRNGTVAVNPLVLQAVKAQKEEALGLLGSSPQGLTEEQAAQRLEEHGPNVLAAEDHGTWFARLSRIFINPLNILLSALAVISFATGDKDAGIIILIIIGISVLLRFVQESKANAAAAKLKAMVSVTATVVRDGQSREVPLQSLVPGDLIRLSAGDMVPADVRLIASKDLFLNQASLTGESYPVEKTDAPRDTVSRSPAELPNICFMGSNVQSGTGTAVVVATGGASYLGGMAKRLVGQQVQTSFDRGINSFTWLMIRFMLVMAPLVFLINGLTKHDWLEAFLFALAVAVGLTPEMLPMIVTVCLSKGAITMSRKKVIVKRLNSIQNFGAMDVLCTDKTGTLTLDHVILERHCDVVRKEDDDVLRLACINSCFQTGLRNVLDRAILEHREVPVSHYRKIDEIPFDFTRKIMSVVVEDSGGGHLLVAKGAPEEILKRCTRFELEGEILPIEPVLVEDLNEEYQHLGEDGFRVLAIAYKVTDARQEVYSKDDEKDLILRGYVAFLDPPKETAARAISVLRKNGVQVKVLTGDNELVTRKVCRDVGLEVEHVLLGAEVQKMSDTELAEAAEKAPAFARLSPADKERIIHALHSRGHVTGFLGDGINDALALKAADVGISVDTAADIAKESADIILLEKSLMVLEEGVIEGRKVFANITKYIKMGASSNFGNMFSVVGASAFLPFLPMTPLQILTNNLLYDVSQIPIPTDEVDAEFLASPRKWTIDEIKWFILLIGPISSIFDYTTFFIMLYLFNCWDIRNQHLFQTGWFVESLLTQTLVIHVIRTQKIPFIQSRASWPLILTTLMVMLVGVWLPQSPLATGWEFRSLPWLYWPLLLAMLLGYLVLTQVVKNWLVGRIVTRLQRRAQPQWHVQDSRTL